MPLVCACSLAYPVPSGAGLYKCARNDATVMYQDEPCPAGKELRDLEREPATVSVVPFRMVPDAPARAGTRPESTGTRSERTSRKANELTSKANGRTSKANGRTSKANDRTRNPAERKFLVPGIGEGEVVARIGRPDMSTGAGRKTVRWTYLPAPEDPGTITMLTFELGRLVHVERKVVRIP